MTRQILIEHGEIQFQAGRPKHAIVDLHLGSPPPEWVPNPHLYPEDGGSFHERWRREVQVAVSPTGRAVHINVDGVDITPELIERLKAEQEQGVTQRSDDSDLDGSGPAAT